MYSKKPLFILAVAALICIHQVSAQNVAINEDGSAANPHAILDLKSSTKGFLLPRIAPGGLANITPVNGMLVYDSSINDFWVGNGFSWRTLTAPAAPAGWSVTGNSGNGPGYFLGTTDGQPLRIRVQNTPSGLIDTLARNAFFGFGTNVLPPDMSGFGTNFENAGFGFYALHGDFNGFANTGIGAMSLYKNRNGSFNTAVGDQTMINNVVGSANTAIGYQSGVSKDSLTNATAIGYMASVNASNKIRIGNSAVTVIEGQVPFTTPSDGRYKFHVQEDVKGLDFILQLRPVTYQFDVKRFDGQLHEARYAPGDQTANSALQAAYKEAAAIRRSGFIAQEVEKAAEASGYDFSGLIRPKTDRDHYSLSYESFVVPLVKAVQEQQRVITDQQINILGQQKRLDNLQQQIDQLKKLLITSK
jgi:trimeric autotransporter adhesin